MCEKNSGRLTFYDAVFNSNEQFMIFILHFVQLLEINDIIITSLSRIVHSSDTDAKSSCELKDANVMSTSKNYHIMRYFMTHPCTSR